MGAGASVARPLKHRRSASNGRLEIRNDPLEGRGVLRAGQSRPARWIQAAPVIIVLAEQCRLLDRTFLHDYYFH